MSLHPFIALSVLRNGLIGNMMKEMNMSTSENAQPVESNQKSNVLDEEQPTHLSVEDWVRVVNEDEVTDTSMTHAIDNLTHIIAKLLQTHMEIAHHLEVISKSIDRVAR